jgi:hypothetical protein
MSEFIANTIQRVQDQVTGTQAPRADFQSLVDQYNSYAPEIANELDAGVNAQGIRFNTDGAGNASEENRVTNNANKVALERAEHYVINTRNSDRPAFEAAYSANRVHSLLRYVDSYLDTAESVGPLNPERGESLAHARDLISQLQTRDTDGEDTDLQSLQDQFGSR